MICTRGLSASTSWPLNEPQVGHDLFDRHAQVLRQVGRLLQHRAQDVAVIRIAGEGARTQHQAKLMRDHHGVLEPELVGLARLALADALHLRRVQRVQLVLVMTLLRADVLGALERKRSIDCVLPPAAGRASKPPPMILFIPRMLGATSSLRSAPTGAYRQCPSRIGSILVPSTSTSSGAFGLVKLNGQLSSQRSNNPVANSCRRLKADPRSSWRR